MRRPLAAGALAPFRVRSFRFQWPADLLTSWSMEMETLILGWYILVETDSVLALTLFGALQFLGSLIAPMFGVIGDRAGRRAMLLVLRALYAGQAAAIMALGLSGLLTPYHVFAFAVLMGLARPADLVTRNALIGDTMPPRRLMRAMSLARTTMDSARIAGALAGTGLFAALGIGWAYVCVAGFYGAGLLLTLGVAGGRASALPTASPWRDLLAGLAYVRRTPAVLAAMWLAFLVNLTAYPITHGLLPYIAREVYRTGETGLGQLAAAFAAGAMLGSVALALVNAARHPGRAMLVGCLGWYLLLLGFAFVRTVPSAAIMLAVIGFVQSVAMVSMSVALLRAAPPAFRGRVMGVRMLAVYGLPLGLLLAGALLERIGFTAMVAICCAVGILLTAWIGLRWRAAIWH